MTRKELINIMRQWLDKNWSYAMINWKDFDFNILNKIMYTCRSGRGNNTSVNDCIIMADTETSKNQNPLIKDNHVVAWTISIRAFSRNIVTLYGHRPDTFCECIIKLQQSMQGEQTIVYIHNLSYDIVFLRQFLFKTIGKPIKQLNTKSHYPIYIEFLNGLILKDSLILAQKRLETWAEDLDVEHKKSVGKWDYEKIRTQHEEFSADELEYIEHDTLAGVECLEATMNTLHKSIWSLPYTATGIPREETRKRGKEYHAHDYFKRIAPTFEQYNKFRLAFHGGFTHGNRHLIEYTVLESNPEFGEISCRDFSSSYPYCLLAFKYPCERFHAINDCSIDYILKYSADYGFIFKLCLVKPKLKNNDIGMPALQFSKCVKCINPILDNGRILAADYIEIYLLNPDLEVISKQYNFEKHLCTEVETARLDYLPRWFTDYIFELFTSKSMLKGIDSEKVNYVIRKATLNSCYGMTVQQVCKPKISENYDTGEYETEAVDTEEIYEKYLNRANSILPYFWGCFCTSYAFRNLFQLADCCGIHLYSDTDSCYGCKWDEEKLAKYNEGCKEKLRANGYGAVLRDDKEYWLGVAEFDGAYSEFRYLGAKRYCGRSKKDGLLHHTVAGVPKRGVDCLNNDINNFTKGFIYPGVKTGKLTHTYIFNNKIIKDAEGNLLGDSIDLTPCDYLLDNCYDVSWEKLFEEEIEVQVYDEET